MPFLSPDWRYPGDKWLRSSECGSLWETARIYRLRMFEGINEMVVKRVCRQSVKEEGEHFGACINEMNVMIYQPHVHLKLANIRDVVTTTISEAFLNLDMKAAIRDIRRFNYVCKVVHLLLTQHFHKLTGRLQLFLIELLRAILLQVQVSCNQTALFRRLLSDLSTNLERHKYDHIGSGVLWQRHYKALEEMISALDGFDIQKKLSLIASSQHPKPAFLHIWNSTAPDDLTLERLPPECLSRVLSFVNCPRDLETASLASGAIASLVEEDHLWRSLTLAHFTMKQISSVHFGRAGWRTEPPATLNDCNWRRAYLRLLKRYGDQHFYSAKLAVCEVCLCLFWPLFGHPCRYPNKRPRSRLLSPEDLITMFEI